MKPSVHLLLVDPLGSFCNEVPAEEQQVVHDGELCVPGAAQDMERVATLIEDPNLFDKIWVFRDQHPWLHISHPCWFYTENLEFPDPFTTISLEAPKKGYALADYKILGTAVSGEETYYSVDPEYHHWTVRYLQQVAKRVNKEGHPPHTIWPPHCLDGTPGAMVVPCVANALLEWSETRRKVVSWIPKGQCPFVESHSGIEPVVPYPKFGMSTGWINMRQDMVTFLLSEMHNADIVVVAGEAATHCVPATLDDIVAAFEEQGVAMNFAQKCVLLTDAMSNVPGFEPQADEFLHRMALLGARPMECDEFSIAIKEPNRLA